MSKEKFPLDFSKSWSSDWSEPRVNADGSVDYVIPEPERKIMFVDGEHGPISNDIMLERAANYLASLLEPFIERVEQPKGDVFLALSNGIGAMVHFDTAGDGFVDATITYPLLTSDRYVIANIPASAYSPEAAKWWSENGSAECNGCHHGRGLHTIEIVEDALVDMRCEDPECACEMFVGEPIPRFD